MIPNHKSVIQQIWYNGQRVETTLRNKFIRLTCGVVRTRIFAAAAILQEHKSNRSVVGHRRP